MYIKSVVLKNQVERWTNFNDLNLWRQIVVINFNS
jgi:hypothetical protein